MTEKDAKQASERSRTVVEVKVVSPPGSRVVESVVVLSDAAAKKLETRGRIPARRSPKPVAGTAR